MENKTVIGLYGAFGVGKSYLAHGLSAKLWDYDMVATDNLLAIARSSDKDDPYLQRSSYLAWQVLGEKTAQNIEEGFKSYRNKLQPLIRTILRRAYEQRVDMIFEGVHLSPEVFREYEGLLNMKLVLIILSNKSKHWERIEKKCADRPALLQRITPHFETAITLQEFLIEEARKNNVKIVDNCESEEKTLANLQRYLNVD